MATGKQQVFIESSSKLKNGLIDGVIEKAGLTGKYKRFSIGVRTVQGVRVRIDFEIDSPDSGIHAANKKQFDRLVSVTCEERPSDTKDFIGKRIGIRIHRGQFAQFESPLRSEVKE